MNRWDEPHQQPLVCYTAPPKMSNRKLIKNALVYTILAGTAQQRQRQQVVEALDGSAQQNFIILFKNTTSTFKFKGSVP
jgi:hypothetical protein